jgi:hypothetical protein
VSKAIDYDLHGCVGIRLLDAGPAEERVVTRQLGPIRKALAREPDLVIRFVDRLELGGPLRLIGANDAAYCDAGFVVLRGKQKSRARVLLPLERAGERCEIVAERGLAAVPHLVALVNLTALARGVLPMHASAFTWNGTGVLATGWAKGGKTEALLAFLSEGAAYVGDEWIYLGEGPRMHGIPEPIRVWDWQLAETPWLRARLGSGARARLAALRALARPLAGLASGGGPAARLARRVQPLVEAQRWVQLPPREFFGAERCVASARPDVLFLMGTHEAPGTLVRPIAAQEVARRMVASLAFERAELVASYWKLRFAFPEARNRFLDGAEAVERELLSKALAGLPAFEVLHPYPVAFRELFEAMRPYCGESPPAGV